MAIPFTDTTGSASIGATVFSLPNGSTTLTAQTTACELEVYIDLSAMIAGDQYRVQVLETVNGVQGVAWEAWPTGVAKGPLWIPARRVATGWDVQLKLTQGVARTVGWTLRKDVADVNALTIGAGAIGAAQLASAAITAAKFAADAIDSAALAASAVTEIQTGLATSSAVASVQADTTTLTGRLTAGRAVNLDNLDAAISTRAAAATAVSNVDYSSARAANLDNLDAAVSSRASSSAVAAVQVDTDDLQVRAADIQGRLPAALDGAGNIKAGVQTIAAGAAATIWAVVSEGTEVFGDTIRLIAARLFGKGTVQDGDGTYSYRDAADTKNRLVMARSGTSRTVTTRDGT